MSISHEAKIQDFTVITDAKGNFDLEIPADLFDKVGKWDVRASFTGDNNLNPSDIGNQETILVRKTRGYAILVQGSIDTAEGADEHGNTLDFVRRSFEAAGFNANIDDPDITSISRSTPDPEEPEEALREAIENWARKKMLAAPAPLYIVLINHGEFGKFHMHPDELSPAELDGMLDNLQRALANADNSLAAEQPIISILGMCFSGSFIDKVSGNIPELPGNNRIIVSAAAPDEFSIRGTGEDDVRQGELFVYTLFRELNQGLSLAESFQNASATVRQLSADRNLAITVNAVQPSFPGEKGQHPLLDDNGDSAGSAFLSGSSADGELASTVFLTQPTNAITALTIDRVSQTVFLEPDQAIPQGMLWAEIDKEPEEIRRIWIEVKKVTDDTGVDVTSTMQHDLELFVEPMDNYVNGQFIGYEWPRAVADPNPFELFVDPGAYQVFFYAESKDERIEISDPIERFVYRASGNHTPADFSLLTPEDGAVVDYNPETPASSGMFTWEASESTGGEVEYIYSVWADPGKDTLVFESGPLNSTREFLPLEEVEEGVDYWWDVVAVDAEGNTKTSALFRFTVKKPNFIPGVLRGKLRDEISGAALADGQVVVSGFNAVAPVDSNGSYEVVVPAGTYEVIAKSPGYLDDPVDRVVVNPSPPKIIVDFNLIQVEQNQSVLTVTSEPEGIPISGSVEDSTNMRSILDTNSMVNLTAPEIFTGADRSYRFVNWVINDIDAEDGNATVSMELTGDTTARAVYQSVVGITLNPGWNLVSVPVNLADFSMETLFAGNSEQMSLFDDRIWNWDGITYQSASQLHPGKGYWIKSPVETFMETNGSIPDPLTESYEKGWQLVGVKGENAFQLNDSIDIRGTIWGWDSENQEYYMIDSPGLPPERQNKLLPGHGYWMYFGEPTTLEFE